MASPNLGAARPRFPGMAGRRMGAGEFMIGTDIGDGAGGWRAAEAVEEAGCCSGTSQSSRLFSRPGGAKQRKARNSPVGQRAR